MRGSPTRGPAFASAGRTAHRPVSQQHNVGEAKERCRLGFEASPAKHMRFASTNSLGCSAVVAHVLWEPLEPMRPRVGSPEHERLSGEGTDYCAVRAHGGVGQGAPGGVTRRPGGGVPVWITPMWSAVEERGGTVLETAWIKLS